MIWLQKLLFAFRDVMRTNRVPVAGTPQIDEFGWLVTAPGIFVRMAHPSWYSSEMRLKTLSGKPVGLVWHFSSTNPGTGAAMARNKQVPRKKTDRESSFHLSIDTDGTIWQSVPFLRPAWHAGLGDPYSGPGVKKPVSPNHALVGIELVGHGKTYTEAQVKAAGLLVAALCEKYGWDSAACRHEHVHFDPERRTDTGEPWRSTHLPIVLRAAGFLISV